jgi:hypothetical protein
MYIFILTHKGTQKKYVGISWSSKKHHILYELEKEANEIPWKRKHLSVALIEYGIDDFDLEILPEIEDMKEVVEQWEQLCDELNSYYPTGYNATKRPVNSGKSITCVETGKIFSSAEELLEVMRISRESLRRSLKDPNIKVKGHSYRYSDE